MPKRAGDPMTPRQGKTNPFALILLLSGSVLFFELAWIRWLPGNIYSMAYFSNLTLMATFFGLGVGIQCGKLKRSLLKAWPVYSVFFVAAVLGLREFNILIPEQSIEWMWSRFSGDQLTQPPFGIPLEPALVGVFFAVAAFFVPLGQALSRLMSRAENLSFYHYDLLGSLAGILLFSLLSAAGSPPFLWFSAGLLLVIPVFRDAYGRKAAAILWPFLLVPAAMVLSGEGERWSPYYSIITQRSGPSGDFKVYVNRFYHQEAVDLDARSIEGYALPYRFFEGGDVLIVGAGTGNDVATALRYDPASIDAVEIDPVILELGRSHPLEPYADPRVRRIVQDARSHLQTTTREYDLIVFGTLDSHALLSSVSTVRLDNYVYTLESIRAAKRRLKPGGVLAMLYSVPTPWIFERLTAMVREVFGPEHALAFGIRSEFLNLVVVARKGAPFGDEWQSDKAPEPETPVLLPTDDWPFLYLEKRGIPRYLVTTILSIIALGSIPMFLLLPPGRRRPEPNFVALGAAFLLVETVTVTRLSLLFGSTWVVNSVVFAGILVMVLLANLAVRRAHSLPVRPIYAGLLAALALNYFAGPSRLLYSSFWVKALVGGGLAACPIFFAGMVFSFLFKRHEDAQYAFGSNILGAFLGGFLEYLGMITGFDALILVVAAIYLVSYFLTTRRSRARLAR